MNNDLPSPALVVGLIGGVSSGKSTIASMLADKGAAVIDADRLGHEVLAEASTIETLHRRFGDQVINDKGMIDRSQLGKLVFGNTLTASKNRKDLEAIVHPKIRKLALSRIEQLRSNNLHRAIILDAPLLLEAGWKELCDLVVFVDTPIELRQAWASSRGWDASELAKREASQASLPTKVAASNFVIHNSIDWDVVTQQVDSLWQRLIAPA